MRYSAERTESSRNAVQAKSNAMHREPQNAATLSMRYSIADLRADLLSVNHSGCTARVFYAGILLATVRPELEIIGAYHCEFTEPGELILAHLAGEKYACDTDPAACYATDLCTD